MRWVSFSGKGHIELIRSGQKTQTRRRHRYRLKAGRVYDVKAAYLSFLNPGDEVIVPAFTFFATASTVIYSNGKPVFADSDPDTFLIDIEDVKRRSQIKLWQYHRFTYSETL